MLCKTHKTPMVEGQGYQIVDFNQEPPRKVYQKLFWCSQCNRFFVIPVKPKNFSVSLKK